jgi:hypothetical protein
MYSSRVVARTAALGSLLTVFSGSAAAQEKDEAPSSAARGPAPTAASETPTVAYTHTAFGVRSGTVGAAGYGESRGGFQSTPPARWGGGLRIWGSPIDRLTLFADAERRDEGNNRRFAPSASVQVRILGDHAHGWALGVLGRYKAEAFAELGGEAEFGVLGSYERRGLHLDGNVVFGKAFEEGESDGELLLRFGYDVLPYLRVGAEGRGRYRMSGDVSLPGGRVWDGFLGPQVLGHYGSFFGALTAGPSNVGIVQQTGWLAILTVGGAAF